MILLKFSSKRRPWYPTEAMHGTEVGEQGDSCKYTKGEELSVKVLILREVPVKPPILTEP